MENLKKIFISIFLLISFSNATVDMSGEEKNISIQNEITVLNKQIEEDNKKKDKKDKTEESMHNIMLMTHQAQSTVKKTMHDYENKEKLAIQSEINFIKDKIRSFEQLNHPAYRETIIHWNGMLKLAKERLLRWKKD